MILAREGLYPVVDFGDYNARCSFAMNELLGVETFNIDIKQEASDKDTTFMFRFPSLKVNELKQKVNVFNSTVLPIPETVDILEDQPGVIMVCGLFVCEDKKFKYGYNFAADKLELGCDRQIASSFGMAWETSKVWAERLNDDLDADKILEMAENNDMDVSDLHFFLNKNGANALEALYIQQHGDVPVHTIGQSAVGRAVSHTLYSSLAIAGSLTVSSAKVESVPHKELRLFFEAEKKHMRRHAKVQFDKLLKKSEDWRN
jgi:hypothetical protein